MTIEMPTVILVEPQNPANIGFVARALDNFGAAGWAQIRGADWRNSEAERTGAPALHRLEKLKLTHTWDDGVAKCTHLIALTARAGRHRECQPLERLGEYRRKWGSHAKVGLVFGREDRGLEADEVDRCTICMTIPTINLSSLNLSHAVATTLYEWNRTRDGEAERSEDRTSENQLSWATAQSRQRLMQKFREELKHMQFPSANTELEDLLRRLESMSIETRDLRVLERIIRHARHLRS
jgi:TrmH family RNA methyltransferase